MHSCANIHGMHALILKVLAEGMLCLDENTVEQQPQYGFMTVIGEHPLKLGIILVLPWLQ